MQHPDAASTASTRPSLLDLFRQAGDEHVGQTLVRLAELAAAADAHQALRHAGDATVSAGAHGWASGRLVSALADERGSARKDSLR